MLLDSRELEDCSTVCSHFRDTFTNTITRAFSCCFNMTEENDSGQS